MVPDHRQNTKVFSVLVCQKKQILFPPTFLLRYNLNTQILSVKLSEFLYTFLRTRLNFCYLLTEIFIGLYVSL